MILEPLGAPHIAHTGLASDPQSFALSRLRSEVEQLGLRGSRVFVFGKGKLLFWRGKFGG